MFGYTAAWLFLAVLYMYELIKLKKVTQSKADVTTFTMHKQIIKIFKDPNLGPGG